MDAALELEAQLVTVELGIERLARYIRLNLDTILNIATGWPLIDIYSIFIGRSDHGSKLSALEKELLFFNNGFKRKVHEAYVRLAQPGNYTGPDYEFLRIFYINLLMSKPMDEFTLKGPEEWQNYFHHFEVTRFQECADVGLDLEITPEFSYTPVSTNFGTPTPGNVGMFSFRSDIPIYPCSEDSVVELEPREFYKEEIELIFEILQFPTLESYAAIMELPLAQQPEAINEKLTTWTVTFSNWIAYLTPHNRLNLRSFGTDFSENSIKTMSKALLFDVCGIMVEELLRKFDQNIETERLIEVLSEEDARNSSEVYRAQSLPAYSRVKSDFVVSLGGVIPLMVMEVKKRLDVATGASTYDSNHEIFHLPVVVRQLILQVLQYMIQANVVSGTIGDFFNLFMFELRGARLVTDRNYTVSGFLAQSGITATNLDSVSDDRLIALVRFRKTRFNAAGTMDCCSEKVDAETGIIDNGFSNPGLPIRVGFTAALIKSIRTILGQNIFDQDAAFINSSILQLSTLVELPDGSYQKAELNLNPNSTRASVDSEIVSSVHSIVKQSIDEQLMVVKSLFNLRYQVSHTPNVLICDGSTLDRFHVVNACLDELRQPQVTLKMSSVDFLRVFQPIMKDSDIQYVKDQMVRQRRSSKDDECKITVRVFDILSQNAAFQTLIEEEGDDEEITADIDEYSKDLKDTFEKEARIIDVVENYNMIKAAPDKINIPKCLYKGPVIIVDSTVDSVRFCGFMIGQVALRPSSSSSSDSNISDEMESKLRHQQELLRNIENGDLTIPDKKMFKFTESLNGLPIHKDDEEKDLEPYIETASLVNQESTRFLAY